jgi:hypothetical protein
MTLPVWFATHPKFLDSKNLAITTAIALAQGAPRDSVHSSSSESCSVGVTFVTR